MFRTGTCLALVVLSSLIAACSPSSDSDPDGEPAARTPKEEPLSDALAVISRDNLEQHLQFLASDERKGRMTGTPEYDESASYVAQQFETLGLEPGGSDGWYQSVPLIANRIDVESATVTVHEDQGEANLKWKEDFIMGGDEVRDETRVRGEVVFVGYGVHAPDMGYSDYEGIDVNGKIVAMFGGAPPAFPHNQRAFYSSSRTKADEMVRRGAIGAVALRSRIDQKRVPWDRLSLNAGVRPGMSWVTNTGDVQDYHPEIEGAAVIDVAAARDLFASAPISFEDVLDAADAGKPLSTPLGVEVTLSRKTSHEEETSPNVIGVIRGSDPELRDEYVVYSAHLDHVGTGKAVNGDTIYNGFYDNAMGIALVIEAARAFAALPEPPRRSILFVVVTGEERGLLGSDYFAHYPTVPPDSMIANVNLDMPLLLYPLADVIAFGAEHSSLESVIETAIKAEDFVLTPDPVPEEVLFIRSDQYSFVRQGVPSVFLFPGFTSTDAEINGEAIFREHMSTHYHRPSDDRTRPVDWSSALRFARANVRIGLAVAAQTARPTWNEGDFFGARFGKERLGHTK
ncbi:MAG: M28 family metallopeptidase [Woeseiaceae bacterium]